MNKEILDLYDINFKKINKNIIRRINEIPDGTNIMQSYLLIKNNNKYLLEQATKRNNYKWAIPGGKIKELETSDDAIKREVKEELGFDNIEYSFVGVSEEFVYDKGYNNHQINLIYKGIYKDFITNLEFKGLEGNWINFKWIDIKDINKYNIFPSLIKQIVKNDNIIYHEIEKIGV